MKEGDGDTWYCFYAVMKLKWKPSEFAFLPRKQRAMMYAFIDEKVKSEKKAIKKSKNKTRRGRR